MYNVNSVQQCRGTGAREKPLTVLRDVVPKNFIQMNITDVMRKVPPLPKNRVQDTRNGHITKLEPRHVFNKVRNKRLMFRNQTCSSV